MALIAQALTTMNDARLTLNLYTVVDVTATETLTANTASITFSFAHTSILMNTTGIFSQGLGTSATTLNTANLTIDFDLGTVTFSAAMTGSITCAGYSYYSWDYTKDKILERMINSFSDQISKYCGRKFVADTYTEFYTGLGSTKLVLNQFPVNKITSVKVQSALYTAGTDYETANSTYLDRGFLVRERGWDWHGYETGLVPELTAPVADIEVVYSAGYTLVNLPYDISNACLDLISAAYNVQVAGAQGLSSMSQGGLSYAWKIGDNSTNKLSSLDSYKKAVF